ncbi:MAG: DUF2384 domain-containing protein [Nevskia sp.]|jgi:putative toxin-antitoxin system antitoxin component (TIGR02293 family)|nr:DUF2384 domain-containing protein [Nevskia sp.]MCK9384929.1 DUF2384 domain-containing protein [Nevskia sp.]
MAQKKSLRPAPISEVLAPGAALALKEPVPAFGSASPTRAEKIALSVPASSVSGAGKRAKPRQVQKRRATGAASKDVTALSGCAAAFSFAFLASGSDAPEQQVQLEKDGVECALLDALATTLALPKTELYPMIGIAKATAESRLRSGARVDGAPGFALISLVALLDDTQQLLADSTQPAAQSFAAGPWLGRWLKTQQPALGGRSPSEYIATPTGQQIVRRLLGSIASGAYQ